MSGRDLAHADSPASPLLSQSLLSVRDGITGHWPGGKTAQGDLNDLRLPTCEAYLDEIGLPAQAAILEAQLVSVVSAKGPEGEATLMYQAHPITRILRPSMEYLEVDLDWVRAYSDLRPDRLPEIHIQLDDMLSYFGALCYLDEGRRKHTLLLLDAVRRLAIHVERMMKYHCRAPRPIDFAQEVQPVIQTPDHSSFPSGHATEAFAIATVLHRLANGQGVAQGIADQALAFRLAHRLAANRTVAGVHFPIDSRAGAWVGCHVGALFHLMATGGELTCGDLPDADFARDADGEILRDADARTATPDFLLSTMPPFGTTKAVTVTKLPVAAALWARAVREWPQIVAREQGA